MKPAPLQLLDYFITKLNLEANPHYKEESQKDANLDTIEVSQGVTQIDNPDDDGSHWRVVMIIKQVIPKGRNIPYKFELELQGEIYAFSLLNGERLEKVVKANAPAMVFGAAREIIRAATGRGPFPAVVIPSTNFITSETKKTAKKTAKKVVKKSSKKTAKKVAKKKS